MTAYKNVMLQQQNLNHLLGQTAGDAHSHTNVRRVTYMTTKNRSFCEEPLAFRTTADPKSK